MIKKIHLYSCLTILLIGFTFLSSCTSKNKQNSNGVVVSGQFQNAENLPLIIEKLGPSGFVFVDSVVTDDKGVFSVSVNEPKIEFYRLRVNPRSFTVFVLDSVSNLIFSGDALNLNQSAQIKGSRANEILIEVNGLASKFFLKNDSIMQIWKNRKDDENEVLLRNRLQADYDNVNKQMSEKLLVFVDNNLNNFATISAVEYLDPDTYLTYYEKVYNALKNSYPHSEYFKGFAARYIEYKRLGVGSEAPEISMRNPLGETKTLSSLKGKIVLLDFWASWCAPCRAESANLVRQYKKYKDKGFEIYSVSLDNDTELWKKAIMQDELTWTHVSDLSNWESKVVPLYNLKAIPQTYLLDKDGKIIAKSLIGESLNKKLVELFGE